MNRKKLKIFISLRNKIFNKAKINTQIIKSKKRIFVNHDTKAQNEHLDQIMVVKLKTKIQIKT
jgi:hypothetical protein